MKHREHAQALSETLLQLDEGARWLRRSLVRCRKAVTKRELTPADFDAFEALTSRYARVSDMILQNSSEAWMRSNWKMAEPCWTP